MRRGTSSPIHETQALLPRTPSSADSAATTNRIRCPVTSDAPRNGSSASGNITWRETATRVTAARRRPRNAVLQAAGSWMSWAICGSATTRPVRKALACRWMAHPVRIAPPAKALTTSATRPSAVHAPNDRRSRLRGMGWASSASASGAPASATPPAGRDGPMAAASVASDEKNDPTL